MDILAELKNEKNKILSNISKGASEGETSLVLSESEKLVKIENLITLHSQIVSELEVMRSEKPGISHKRRIRVKPKESGNESRSAQLASSRELGEKIRYQFIRKLETEGIHLQSIRGKTIYQTKSGKRVGIAVATERQPNRWFLGLPADGFDHAVLLCQRGTGEVIEVLLPEKFFAKYGADMSVSNEQMKFNIVHRGTGLLVQVPGTDGIRGNSFANDYSFLG